MFTGSLRKLQYAVVTVILHPSLECWVWQIYFPKTQRTFSISMYSSDLFALDDSILNNEKVVNAADPGTALWTYLI